MARIKRLVRFQARATDGAEYTIEVSVMMYPAATRRDPNGEEAGPPRFETPEGYAVQKIAKGRYVIDKPSGRVEVTTTDPNEPDI